MHFIGFRVSSRAKFSGVYWARDGEVGQIYHLWTLCFVMGPTTMSYVGPNVHRHHTNHIDFGAFNYIIFFLFNEKLINFNIQFLFICFLLVDIIVLDACTYVITCLLVLDHLYKILYSIEDQV